MAETKPQTSQIVNEGAFVTLGTAARAQVDAILAAINTEVNQPLRLRAESPATAKLVIGASQLLSGDTGGKVVSVVNDVVGNFVQTTIDFQTGAIVGGSVTRSGGTFTLPTTTIGQFRRVVFVYVGDINKVDCAFSAAAASVAALDNPGTILTSLDGLPIGYVDLEATASTAYKTAGSATSIIENSVGGVARISRFGAGSGSGSGKGDETVINDRLENELQNSQYEEMVPLVFVTNKNTLTDTGVSNGNLTSKFYELTTGQIFASSQLLDNEFLADPTGVLPKVITEANITVYWDQTRTDTAAIYQISRDGGNQYQTVTLSRIGTTNAFQGNMVFTEESSQQSLVTQATTTTQKELNTTTQSKIAQSFVLAAASVVKSVDLQVVKTGSPSGKFTVQLIKNNAGVPSTVATDILATSSLVDISTLVSGTVTVTLPATALAAGTYHVVISSDLPYQTVFSAGVTSIAFASNATTDGLTLFSVASQAWADSSTDGLKLTVKGSALDLRFKVTASASTVALQGFGIFLNRAYSGITTGVQRYETQSFKSVTNNTSTFTLTKFLPDPSALKVYWVEKAQVAVYPAFQINGQQVIFPANTFNNGGVDVTVTLLFDQSQGAGSDSSDSNANAIATNTAWSGSGFVDDVVLLNKVNAPFTTVVKRAQMVDLSQDLLPRMGVERIPIQQIMQVFGETGPSGESVFKPINDKYDQIRLIGTAWVNQNNTDGVFTIEGTGAGTPMEISFYGTGLNLLSRTYVAATIVASIDGGAYGANISTVSNSAVLTGRNYNPNQVINVVSGLALGLHTVSIKCTVSNMGLNGVEILNEGLRTTGNITSGSNLLTGLASTVGIITGALVTGVGIPAATTVSSISGTTVTMSANATATTSSLAVAFGGVMNVTPASSATKGKKLTASQSFLMYNSTFETGTLGSRGGRVLVYQKSDGTIAKSVTPTNTSAATTTSADHTNEEIIRNYSWREFGAGRADDFSTLATSISDRGFTLDDGVTSLVATSVLKATVSGYDVLRNSGSTKILVFTFIGTGIDLLRADDANGAGAGSDQVTVQIDGGSTINLSNTGSTTPRIEKIASGLPYGTHTVRFNIGTPSVYDLCFLNFIVWGPKKPTLPAGAIELADYNVVADYAIASSSQPPFVSQGVVRKMGTREAVYTGTVSIGGVDPTNFQSGFNTTTTTSGSSGSLVFWGSGVEYHGRINNADVANLTVLVDGVALNTGSNASATVSLLSSVVTGLSLSAAGVLTGTASGVGDFIIRISGLPIGLHTVKVTTGNTASEYFDCWDVITPIHVNKNNGPFSLQNTIAVGSQGINDGRKFGSQLTTIGQHVRLIPVSAGTTTSASEVPMAMQTPIYLDNDASVSCAFEMAVFAAAGQNTRFFLRVDGALIETFIYQASTGTGDNPMILERVVPMTKGYHIVTMGWSTAGGTLSMPNLASGGSEYGNLTLRKVN